MEVLSFVKGCISDFGLHSTAMKFFPFEAVEIVSTDIDRVFIESASFRELALTLERPVLPAENQMDFLDKNSGCLLVTIEHPTRTGLPEACLRARTEDSAALSVWRKIAARLKKMTVAGVTATNRKTGQGAFYRSIRYTPGAATAEAHGTAMLPPQGPNGPLIRLGNAIR